MSFQDRLFCSDLTVIVFIDDWFTENSKPITDILESPLYGQVKAHDVSILNVYSAEGVTGLFNSLFINGADIQVLW